MKCVERKNEHVSRNFYESERNGLIACAFTLSINQKAVSAFSPWFPGKSQ